MDIQQFDKVLKLDTEYEYEDPHIMATSPESFFHGMDIAVKNGDKCYAKLMENHVSEQVRYCLSIKGYLVHTYSTDIDTTDGGWHSGEYVHVALQPVDIRYQRMECIYCDKYC